MVFSCYAGILLQEECLCMTHCEPFDWLTQFSYITLCTLHICIVWHCTFSITHTRLHILHYSMYITHFTLVCHWLMCELVWEITWDCSAIIQSVQVCMFVTVCMSVYCTCIDNDTGWVCISEQVFMGVQVCNSAWNKHLS